MKQTQTIDDNWGDYWVGESLSFSFLYRYEALSIMEMMITVILNPDNNGGVAVASHVAMCGKVNQ